MRIGTVAAALAVALVGCSAPTEVLVSRADDAPPAAGSDPAPTATPPAEVSAERSPADLLLTVDDVPGWQYAGPMEVADEPTFEATDCDLVNTVWGAAARSGVRARGIVDGARFRNTVVVLDDVASATAILDAADQVWQACPVFSADLGEWWIEPLQMPSSDARSAGVVLGGTDIEAWAIGLWQIDDVVVVLELNGGDMWAHVDAVLATQAARVAGDPQPLPATTIPGGRPDPDGEPTDTLPPVAPPPPDTLPPQATLPPIVDGPGRFPPEDEAWSGHELAGMVPAPSELGPGWEYRSGSISEAAPPDPDDTIPGCDVAPPPTLDGVDVSYERRTATAELELELSVWRGDVASAGAVLDAFAGLPGCDLGSVGVEFPMEVVEIDRPALDDSLVLTGTTTSGEVQATFVIALARVDGTVIVVALGALGDGPEDADRALTSAVETLDLVVARR